MIDIQNEVWEIIEDVIRTTISNNEAIESGLSGTWDGNINMSYKAIRDHKFVESHLILIRSDTLEFLTIPTFRNIVAESITRLREAAQ